MIPQLLPWNINEANKGGACEEAKLTNTPIAPATQLGCIDRKVEMHPSPLPTPPPQVLFEEEKLRNEPFLSARLVSCWLLDGGAWVTQPGAWTSLSDHAHRMQETTSTLTPFLLFLLAKHPLWSPQSPTDGLVQRFCVLEQDRSQHNSVCSILATV